MISAIVLAKNEEKNLGECLGHLQWCDEIIVLDDFSTDSTPQIAIKSGSIYAKRKLTNFADQRNFALTLAKFEWVLFIDSDEIVSEDLRNEIQHVIATDSTINGYFLKRVDLLWNKTIKYGDGKDIQLLRLAKKNTGKWIGAVHEVWDIKDPTRSLLSPLLHSPHQTVAEFLDEINKYSTLRALELIENKKKANSFIIVMYTIGKFLDNYLLKLGFLDGTHGLIRALMMSYYSFLVRAKLWTLNQKRQ